MAVRDRYGIKPLFWTVAEGRLLVAAEMKAFKSIAGVKFEWDVRSIADGSTNFGYATTFKNIEKANSFNLESFDLRLTCSKVRPGHYLVCKSFGPISQHEYWNSDYPDKTVEDNRSEDEMIEDVRKHLMEAIRLRLRADVKVGISLSGGLDSSIVAGMTNQLIKEGEKVGGDAVTDRLSCFGVAFDEDSGFDESAIADRTAQHLGVRFYKKNMNEQSLADQLEDATWHCEQPYADLNFIGIYALSELVREQGFRVLLNGQGSDEIFGGYSFFLPDFLREPDSTFIGPRIPEPERREALDAAEKAAPLYTLTQPDKLLSSPIARQQLNNTTAASMMATSSPSLPFSPWIPETYGNCDQQLTFCVTINGSIISKIQHKWHPLHTAEYLFTTATLPNILLSHLGDRGEMAHSIEGRTPFLDHKLTEYVNSLPPSMKIRPDPHHPGTFLEKWVLKEAAKPLITEEIYTRKKHPYSAPVLYPVGGPIHGLMKRLITEESVEGLGFLVSEGIAERVERCFREQDRVGMRELFMVAQFVVLGRAFGVPKAVPRSG
ncbi:hypothetical protein EPUS_03201 [Endocarpon pusillum Z07020]|uniref:Asparagine synthetase domain-containing protein n=1 Tax=Endocarpon pusillum (strain Z07020 / HMAS-L-300199) TaxID=1263415 RepID=U1GB97_ENDPU|nr:uncharacterized protein EPUS_03201 [Endocarpon pusillum Z07020]ERF74817.1 hypothetical protein EPUS_03201 [Endocarpon pusillum Z07020]